MHLPDLLSRKRLIVLGINSGTSIDGVDIAALAISRRGRAYSVRLEAGAEIRFPARLRAELLACASQTSFTFSEYMQLHDELGRFLGNRAAAYIDELTERNLPIHLVASHGQTVRHLPGQLRDARRRVSGTLQAGSLAMIAAATERVVVGDFRQGNVALGGEGAPITGAAMARLFGSRSHSRVIVNIGGIANYFFIPGGDDGTGVETADCGPGNILSDQLCRVFWGKSYDRNGAKARSGGVSRRLLTLLLARGFFRSSGTQSTGREAFTEDVVQTIVEAGSQLHLSPNDILATTAQVTVESIATHALRLAERNPSLSKLYLTGGGACNRFFTEQLARRLPGFSVLSIDRLGIPSGLVEAAAYAVMGEGCIRSESLDSYTNPEGRRAVLGSIVQPPR